MTLPTARRHGATTLFRLDSSIRVEGSVSRALADIVEQEWARIGPNVRFVRRDLGRNPLPSVWPDAASSLMTPPEARSDAQRAASDVAAELVDELLGADAFLFAVPMYNFGVPQQVKHWIDMIIADPRAADVNHQWLAGRPTVLVEVHGGGYAPGTPRDGWNHVTPYLRTMLVDVWGLDLVTVTAELTAAEDNPTMADLRDLARQQLAHARSAAVAHASHIANRLRAAA